MSDIETITHIRTTDGVEHPLDAQYLGGRPASDFQLMDDGGGVFILNLSGDEEHFNAARNAYLQNNRVIVKYDIYLLDVISLENDDPPTFVTEEIYVYWDQFNKCIGFNNVNHYGPNTFTIKNGEVNNFSYPYDCFFDGDYTQIYNSLWIRALPREIMSQAISISGKDKSIETFYGTLKYDKSYDYNPLVRNSDVYDIVNSNFSDFLDQNIMEIGYDEQGNCITRVETVFGTECEYSIALYNFKCYGGHIVNDSSNDSAELGKIIYTTGDDKTNTIYVTAFFNDPQRLSKYGDTSLIDMELHFTNDKYYDHGTLAIRTSNASNPITLYTTISADNVVSMYTDSSKLEKYKMTASQLSKLFADSNNNVSAAYNVNIIMSPSEQTKPTYIDAPLSSTTMSFRGTNRNGDLVDITFKATVETDTWETIACTVIHENKKTQ